MTSDTNRSSLRSLLLGWAVVCFYCLVVALGPQLLLASASVGSRTIEQGAELVAEALADMQGRAV